MNRRVGDVGILKIDRSLCIGSGHCVQTAPEVFGQDDEEGLVEVIDGDIDQTLANVVEESVDGCPSGAISLSAG